MIFFFEVPDSQQKAKLEKGQICSAYIFTSSDIDDFQDMTLANFQEKATNLTAWDQRTS